METAYSAGVLPYAVDEQGGVWVLLGQERHQPGWKDSLKWSLFSGRRVAGESTIEAAAREFEEETLGVGVLGQGVRGVRSTIAALETSPCVVFKSQHRRKKDVYFTHTVFLTRVTRDDAIVEAFKATHLRLYKLDAALCRHSALVQTSKISKLLTAGGRVSKNIIVTDVNADGLTAIVTLRDTANSSVTVVEVAIDEAQTRLIETVSRSHSAIADFIVNHGTDVLTHPAVALTRFNDCVLSGRVQSEYLEKIQIRWYSMSELVRLAELDPAESTIRPTLTVSLSKLRTVIDDVVERSRGHAKNIV